MPGECIDDRDRRAYRRERGKQLYEMACGHVCTWRERLESAAYRVKGQGLPKMCKSRFSALTVKREH